MFPFAQFPDDNSMGWNPYPSNDGWAGAAQEVVKEVSKFGLAPLLFVLASSFFLIAFFFVLWKFNGPLTELFKARIEESKERKRLAEERKNYYIRSNSFIEIETQFQAQCSQKLTDIEKLVQERHAATKENVAELIEGFCNFGDSLINATMPLTEADKPRFDAVKREILGIRQLGQRLE